MNAGIEMLVERLKTHPEDFEYNIHVDAWRTEWGSLLQKALHSNCFTEEEKKTVENARLEWERDCFTNQVLILLTANKKEDRHEVSPTPLTPVNSYISTTNNLSTGIGIGIAKGPWHAVNTTQAVWGSTTK